MTKHKKDKKQEYSQFIESILVFLRQYTSLRSFFRIILIPRGVIYKATNTRNNMIYIGKTTRGLEKRKQEHLRDAFKKHKNTKFHKGLRGYGWRSFQWEVIGSYPYSIFCYRDKDCELCDAEVYYINELDSRAKGYNGTWGYDSRCSYKKIGSVRELIFITLTEDDSDIAMLFRLVIVAPFLIFGFFIILFFILAFFSILFS